MRVLVVDDDEELLDLLARALGRDGHAVRTAASASAAREELATSPSDVVVLDLALPDASGIALCRELRAGHEDVPILMLTAHSEVGRRIEGLDAGADDFLGKPFSIAELRARLRALGRRRSASRAAPSVLTMGGTRLDFGARLALRGGAPVALTGREWAVLEALALRRGRVVPRDALLEEVWGDQSDSSNASLEVLVARIRRKSDAAVIRTVRGEGYALGGAEDEPG